MGKSIDVSGYRYLPDKNGKNKKASLSKKKKSSGVDSSENHKRRRIK